jgi:thioredoxin 1
MSKLTNLKNQVEKEKALMIYFYNNDCAPCISLRPKIELLMANFPKMKLNWINSKTHPEVTAAYSVFSNPTILLFFEGKEYRRFSKFVSMIELEEVIRRYYNILFDIG